MAYGPPAATPRYAAAPNGSRETARSSATWRIDRNASDGHVVITDDGVRFAAPA
jgi:hypothetical protein